MTVSFKDSNCNSNQLTTWTTVVVSVDLSTHLVSGVLSGKTKLKESLQPVTHVNKLVPFINATFIQFNDIDPAKVFKKSGHALFRGQQKCLRQHPRPLKA